MKKLLILLLLLNYSPNYYSAESYSHTRFAVPKGLETNVDFWEDIFRVYSINQVVIHDSEHLNVIYEVLDFQDNPYISNRKKNQVTKKCRAKYKKILNRIIKNKTHPERLTEAELVVYKKFEGIEGKNKFHRAVYRIRAQSGIKERFKEGYIRSKMYTGDFRRIFREHGLPEELTYLPHVESSFNVDAYSHCGAAGIWQFTRSTGKMYLKINKYKDERRDPYLSTVAAAKLLKKNYEELGEWPLAITAYNHGLYGVKKAKRTLKTNDIVKIVREYRGKRFGFASRNFYAEFLAAMNVAKGYDMLETPTKIASLQTGDLLQTSYLP